MPAEHGTRVKRMERAVREELASLLEGQVKDPGARGAVITRVTMTDDLRSAKVHVRLLTDGDDVARRKTLVDALGRASGMLRREVTQALGLRNAPELRFVYDDGQDNTTRVEQLLAEIRRGAALEVTTLIAQTAWEKPGF